MKTKIFFVSAVLFFLAFTIAQPSFGAVIWATQVIESRNVFFPERSLNEPGGGYASIGYGYLTVGFGDYFLDLHGDDVIVVDAVADWAEDHYGFKVGDVYAMQARRADGVGWSSLTFDESVGGWRSLEIGDSYTGYYDQIRLMSFFGGGDRHFEVDAIGVLNPLSSIPVPEPSTMLLIGSGLVGVAVLGRKKWKGLRQ